MWFCWSSAAASPSMVLVVSVTAGRARTPRPSGSSPRLPSAPCRPGDGPWRLARPRRTSRARRLQFGCIGPLWLPRRDMTGGPTPRRSPARARRARRRAAATTGDVTARPFRFRAAAARRRCRAPSNEIRRAKRRPRPARCPGRERKTRAARGWGRAMSRPTRGLPEAYAKWTADGPRNRSPGPRRRLAPDPPPRRACQGAGARAAPSEPRPAPGSAAPVASAAADKGRNPVGFRAPGRVPGAPGRGPRARLAPGHAGCHVMAREFVPGGHAARPDRAPPMAPGRGK